MAIVRAFCKSTWRGWKKHFRQRRQIYTQNMSLRYEDKSLPRLSRRKASVSPGDWLDLWESHFICLILGGKSFYIRSLVSASTVDMLDTQQMWWLDEL